MNEEPNGDALRASEAGVRYLPARNRVIDGLSPETEQLCSFLNRDRMTPAQFFFDGCEIVHMCPSKNILGSRNLPRERDILTRATICRLGMSPPQPPLSVGPHHLDRAPGVSPSALPTFNGPPKERTIDFAGSMREKNSNS